MLSFITANWEWFLLGLYVLEKAIANKEFFWRS